MDISIYRIDLYTDIDHGSSVKVKHLFENVWLLFQISHPTNLKKLSHIFNFVLIRRLQTNGSLWLSFHDQLVYTDVYINYAPVPKSEILAVVASEF